MLYVARRSRAASTVRLRSSRGDLNAERNRPRGAGNGRRAADRRRDRRRLAEPDMPSRSTPIIRRAQRKSFAAQFSAQGGRAAVVPADLSDHDAVLRLVGKAATAVGPLTLLVNNAGEFEPDAIGSSIARCFDRQFAINLRAPLFLIEKFAAQVPAGADAQRDQYRRSAGLQARRRTSCPTR